jgi:hypothetical protein
MWVMSSKRVTGGVDFCIGAVKVASVQFAPGGKAALWIGVPDDEVGTFACASVKEAMQLMHKKLQSPPPEGFETPQFSRQA